MRKAFADRKVCEGLPSFYLDASVVVGKEGRMGP